MNLRVCLLSLLVKIDLNMFAGRWRILVDGWQIFATGWQIFATGWQIFVTGWQIFASESELP